MVAALESVPDANADRAADRPLEKSNFQVQQVLKGDALLGDNRRIAANYFGQAKVGTTFLLLGTQEGTLLWSVPIPISFAASASGAVILPSESPCIEVAHGEAAHRKGVSCAGR